MSRPSAALWLTGPWALLLACAAPERPRDPGAVAPLRAAERPSAARASAPAPTQAPATTPASQPQTWPAGAVLDASVLEPDPVAVDGELDRIAGRTLHKHDVYDRLLELDAPRATELRELLCLDLLVAAEVRAQGIRVTTDEVQVAVEDEVGKLKGRFDAELKGRMTFAEFLSREFGLDEAGYRQWLWRRTARALLRERAVRYWSWRHDRITCRFLRVSDPALAQELHHKLAAGADLGILARKHSEDETRELGGLLPEFAEGFQHPVAKIARTLKTGEFSTVVAVDAGEPRGLYLVHCLSRSPARHEPYAAVAEELCRDLKKHPVSAFESTAFYLAQRGMENPLEGSSTHR